MEICILSPRLEEIQVCAPFVYRILVIHAIQRQNNQVIIFSSKNRVLLKAKL